MVTFVLDTSVIIHLDDVRQLRLLGQLQGLDFIFPGEVWEELVIKERRMRVADGVRRGWLRRKKLDLVAELPLRKRARDDGLDLGEAAGLALAESRGLHFATDDFAAVKVGQNWLGPGRLVTTPGLVTLAIQQGILEVHDADKLIKLWGECRFKVAFQSFRELLPS